MQQPITVNKLIIKLGVVFESGTFPLICLGLALLVWWLGVLRQFLIWFLFVVFSAFVVVLTWTYWEDRPDVPLVRKALLTLGWLYLFITVNLLMVGEPFDSAGWVNPLHAIGALLIVVFYPIVWLYRLIFG